MKRSQIFSKRWLENRIWEIWKGHHDFGEELDGEGAIEELIEAAEDYKNVHKRRRLNRGKGEVA